MTPMKRCSVCREEFPETAEYFYEDRRYSPPRLRSACKGCQNVREARNRDPEKARQKAQRYRERDPERYRRILRESRSRHIDERRKADREAKRRVDPEKRRAYNREWATRNPDKIFQYQRKFYPTVRRKGKDPAKRLASAHRYFAKKRALPSAFTGLDWQYALEYFNHCCAVCGRPLSGLFHKVAADHWIPLSSPDCPGTVVTNIVPLCHGQGGCNNSKADQNPEEWLVKRFGKRKAQHIVSEIGAYFAHVRDRSSSR